MGAFLLFFFYLVGEIENEPDAHSSLIMAIALRSPPPVRQYSKTSKRDETSNDELYPGA